MEQEKQPALMPVMTYFSVIRDPRIERNEPPHGKPCGILSVVLVGAEARSARKFIIPSGLIPNLCRLCLT
jgi:hypothetical protein